MSDILHIDFETRSQLDLKSVGLHNYARHDTTDVWCMAWAFHDGPVRVTAPYHATGWDSDEHTEIVCHLARGGTVVAHNAPFELAIWNNVMVPRYGWPVLKPEQVQCTMAMALAMALPASLENAAAAVGLDVNKDMSGHRLMMQMCRPRSTDGGKIVWWDDPEKLQRLYAYCKQDVLVERQLYDRLLKLSESEQRIWQLDYRINNRGIAIDLPAVEAAIRIVGDEKLRLDKEMRRLTNNAVATCQAHSQLKDWLLYQNIDTAGVAKADIKRLVDEDDADISRLPDHVRRVLNVRREAAKTSTAKLSAMVSGTSADGRIRNTTQYHAATTGRWGGRRIQPQNLPRPKLKQAQIEEVFAILESRMRPEQMAQQIDLLYGPPMEVLSDCLRGFLTAGPGNDLMACDFANIEGRVLAWLAGEEWKLDAFRAFDAGTGPDLYLVAAGRIYNCTPTEATPHRQIGKVCELQLGFGGGAGAFQSMARLFGIVMPDSQADDIKKKWRAAHREIERFWYDAERAAVHAVQHPGKITGAGAAGREIRFRVNGSFLWMKLPSGRNLAYPYPRLAEISTPWGEPKQAVTFKTYLDSQARKKAKLIDDPTNSGNWYRVATYGGSLVENATQAVARDVLADAMVRLEAAGYPICLTIHDEIVCERKAGEGSVEEMSRLMCELSPWMAGLPIASEGWRNFRYKK